MRNRILTAFFLPCLLACLLVGCNGASPRASSAPPPAALSNARDRMRALSSVDIQISTRFSSLADSIGHYDDSEQADGMRITLFKSPLRIHLLQDSPDALPNAAYEAYVEQSGDAAEVYIHSESNWIRQSFTDQGLRRLQQNLPSAFLNALDSMDSFESLGTQDDRGVQADKYRACLRGDAVKRFLYDADFLLFSGFKIRPTEKDYQEFAQTLPDFSPLIVEFWVDPQSHSLLCAQADMAQLLSQLYLDNGATAYPFDSCLIAEEFSNFDRAADFVLPEAARNTALDEFPAPSLQP